MSLPLQGTGWMPRIAPSILGYKGLYLNNSNLRRVRQIDRRCPRPCRCAPPACAAGAIRTSRSSSTAAQVALDPQVQAVAVLDAVVGRVRRPHVDVPLVADHAALQLDHAGRAHQVAARRVAVVAALAHRDVEAQEIASVNASSTWLWSRHGPRMRRFGIIRCRGPMIVTVSSAAKKPSW